MLYYLMSTYDISVLIGTAWRVEGSFKKVSFKLGQTSTPMETSHLAQSLEAPQGASTAKGLGVLPPSMPQSTLDSMKKGSNGGSNLAG